MQLTFIIPFYIAFIRKNENDEVLVILNLSCEEVDLEIFDPLIQETFTDVFNNERIDFCEKQNIKLQRWNYRVYEKEKAL